MAVRTIVTCDLCKEEIKPGERIIHFSAARFAAVGGEVLEDFPRSEFCSDACVIGAVRGLLNGGA